jgi:hypothetical protein
MTSNDKPVDGTGSAAQMTDISGITTDGTDLYVTYSDYHIVRKVVVANAEIRLLAGVVNDYSTAAAPGPNPILTATLESPTAISYSPTLGLLVGSSLLVQIK